MDVEADCARYEAEISSCDCPYLIAPAAAWAILKLRSSVSDFTGAAGPSEASHWLKSRFMPYLSTIEQSSSLPLAFARPEQVFHLSALFCGFAERTLGMSAGSTTTTPRCLRIAIASSITFVWSALRPPRGSFSL